ncbi:MAG TPA: S49 family peptidase, partial [Sphingobacteriaceae bacterium]|nr:S49 family peptidase [Sphingobacteriaceae bacterium]
MDNINHFYLISTLLRGKFFVSPDYAIAAGSQVANILNRDWDGMPTTDLEKQTNRAKLPIAAVSYDKEVFSSYDAAPEGSTALIPLKGSMLKYGTWCTYGTEEVAAMINAAAMHRKINSIVLDIDSGGGSVDSVAPIVQAIKFSQSQDKPVVASVDMACSAAYWAASQCNSIIADNNISATIGSIGVMMSFWDVKGYYEAQGYKLHVVYAPESDSKNLPFEKALEGEYDLIKTEELSP